MVTRRIPACMCNGPFSFFSVYSDGELVRGVLPGPGWLLRYAGLHGDAKRRREGKSARQSASRARADREKGESERERGGGRGESEVRVKDIEHLM